MTPVKIAIPNHHTIGVSFVATPSTSTRTQSATPPRPWPLMPCRGLGSGHRRAACSTCPRRSSRFP
eukprot:11154381-Lingulodinium_polyedra.AAC.1